MKRNHCRFCCSVAGTEYRHWCWFIQPTTELFACLALSDNIVKLCCLTAGHTELHLGDEASSQISPVSAQRRPDYDNDSFSYVTTGAESDQPVGAPWYQWGCRDAGITGFHHSWSWQAQGGPAYICRNQRKHVFFMIWDLLISRTC